jgi:hypothetical protein
MSREIVSRLDWIGVRFLDPDASDDERAAEKPEVRLLDYACGPGIISRVLLLF